MSGLPSITDIVEVIKSGTFVSGVIFVSTAAILTLIDNGIYPFILISDGWLALNGAACVFSGATLAISFGSWLISESNPAVRWNQNRKLLKDLSERLDDLPEAELLILRYLLTQNTQVFTASFNNSRLVPLVMKGFIIRTGGTGLMTSWPFRVADPVWSHLKKNEDKYLIDMPSNSAKPWVTDWV